MEKSKKLIGYKAAWSSDEDKTEKLVIIELEIIGDDHNLNRKVVNKQFAKHRSKSAKVLGITDLNGNELKEAYSDYNREFKYLLEKTYTIDDYNLNPDLVCGKGIHFFLSREPAETYLIDKIDNGLYKSYHEDGQVSKQCFYQDGKLEGQYLEYFENGQISEQCFYQDGKLEGEHIRYYQNGQLQVKCSYKNGELEGECLIYYQNGQLKEKSLYQNGNIEGEYLGYYQNGQISDQCFHKNGELEGQYLEYNQDGQLEIKSFYKNGILETE
jgi:hypothetical protein